MAEPHFKVLHYLEARIKSEWQAVWALGAEEQLAWREPGSPA